MTKPRKDAPARFDFSVPTVDVGLEQAGAPPPAGAPAPPPRVDVPAAPRPRESDGMHPTALVFLDDPIARKLAVAWTLGARTGTSMSDEDWLRAAGMPHSLDAQRTCRALKANNVCRDGGVTDALAMQYIATIVAAPLTKQRKDK